MTLNECRAASLVSPAEGEGEGEGEGKGEGYSIVVCTADGGKTMLKIESIVVCTADFHICATLSLLSWNQLYRIQ